MGNRNRSFLKLSLASGVALAATAHTNAQTSVERFNRQLEQIQRQTALEVNRDLPVGRRSIFDYGGYYSFNYLTLDDELEENHVLRQHDLTGYARFNVDGVHEFFARGRLSWQDFNPGDSFDGEGDDFEPTLERAYYRFDLQRAKGAYAGEKVDSNFVLQAGRQLVYWGNGLVLSQTLDAVVAGFTTGPFDLLVMGGLTPKRTTDFDSSRPDFDDDTHRGFYGAMLTGKIGGDHRPYVYILFQDDQNHDQTLSVGPTETSFNYNSHYIGIGSNGVLGDRLAYGIELAYEGGRTLSNSFELTDSNSISPVDQTRDPIYAWGADVRLDYLFNDIRRSRGSGEFIIATGDDDRLNSNNTFGGNAPGTADGGFNAFGLLNTGLAFAPSVSNVAITRIGASTFPIIDHSLFRNLQIGFDFFVFMKVAHDGPIDEPTQTNRFLGYEPDIFLNWQIRSDVTLALRYGVFIPDEQAIVNDDLRHFFFGGLTFAF